MLEKLKTWARVKSPWILHFNSGACNACDIEILAALMPHYDLERFGVLLKASPRHADVLVCSGPVTKQIAKRLGASMTRCPNPSLWWRSAPAPAAAAHFAVAIMYGRD